MHGYFWAGDKGERGADGEKGDQGIKGKLIYKIEIVILHPCDSVEFYVN